MMQFFPLLRLTATSLGRKMALKLLHALALRFASCACWVMALKLLHALALRFASCVCSHGDGSLHALSPADPVRMFTCSTTGP
ncbi:hypothetical protein DFH11DRAFT_1634342 [Phellopilus nigrolimitatus]|nr:hypothetical protein DFH11DRAFT_1634342 [Phellopilus nigrolimitatus]